MTARRIDFVKCWSILCSPQLYYVHIPPDDKSGQALVQLLAASGLDFGSPTLIFKAEVASMMKAEAKFLQRCRHLTIFVHRKGADNALMKVLGQNCPFLQVGQTIL